jgi:hypothetical protein
MYLKLPDIDASGTEPEPTAWLTNFTNGSAASPDAAPSKASNTAMSSRSNTASIEEVTRFSPCRYVEKSGLFMECNVAILAGLRNRDVDPWKLM